MVNQLINNSQGLFKMGSSGIIWELSISDLKEYDQSFLSYDFEFFSYVGEYNGNIYCVGYSESGYQLRIYEISSVTGTINRVSPNFGFSGVSNYVHNILINSAGTMALAGPNGFIIVDLNNLLLVKSAQSVDEEFFDFYPSNDFVDGQGNFWFMHQGGSVIVKIKSSGDATDLIFITSWDNSTGVSSFTRNVTFTTNYLYDLRNVMESEYESGSIDILYNTPLPTQDGIYISVRANVNGDSGNETRFYKLTQTTDFYT